MHREDVAEELNKRNLILNKNHCLLVKLRGLCVFGKYAKRFIESEEEAKITLAVANVFEKGTGYHEHGKSSPIVFSSSIRWHFPPEFLNQNETP
ncbi:MAG: hypothetical protein OQK12_11245 [Motiliproteus sp.]|nr:hypothetical protein [Motiliproteus sp.]MCW9053027.1 hypothetical protein [Motiliproteus sp.]